MNAESLCVPRDQPEKEREGEGERKKEREKKRKTWGDQAFLVSEAHCFIFLKGLLYPNLYIEGNERRKVIQSQPKHYICFVFIKPGFFQHTFPINNIVYIIFWP